MLRPMGYLLMVEVHRVSLDMGLVVGGSWGGVSHDLSSERIRTLLRHQLRILHDFIDLNEYSMILYCRWHVFYIVSKIKDSFQGIKI